MKRNIQKQNLHEARKLFIQLTKAIVFSSLCLFNICYACDFTSVYATTTVTDITTTTDTDINTPSVENPTDDQPATTPVKTTGWEQQPNGNWKYYDTNSYVTNCFQKINGNTYAFNKYGYVRTGLIKKDGNTYYFKTFGKAGELGKMLTGLRKIDGKLYYFKDNGKMATGWKKINGNNYYFKPKGKLGVKGQATTGLKKINGKKYYFKKGGKMFTGLKTVNGKTYLFKPTGKLGKKGAALTGWQTYKNKTYYFYQSGKMAKNTYIEGYEITNKGTLSKKGETLRKKVISLAKKYKKNSTTEAALKKCFYHVVNHTTYKSDRSTPNGAADEMNNAYQVLIEGNGNCYKFAAAFVYLAEELGYNAKCKHGYVSNIAGGLARHGWVEIRKNGTTYVYDPDLQYELGNRYNYEFFNLTYESSIIKYTR